MFDLSLSLSIRLSSLVFGIGSAFIGWSLIGTRVKPSSVTIFPMLRHHLVPPRPLPPPPPHLSPWPSSSYITWVPLSFFFFVFTHLTKRREEYGFFLFGLIGVSILTVLEFPVLCHPPPLREPFILFFYQFFKLRTFNLRTVPTWVLVTLLR